MVQRKSIFFFLFLAGGMSVLQRKSTEKSQKYTKESYYSLGGFEVQVSDILRRRQVNSRDFPGIYRAMDDMAIVLRTLWPGAKLEPFGSLFTGLGTVKSDLDCFVKLPGNQEINESALVEIAGRALQQYPHLFTPVIVKGNAIVPIVRTVHVPTSRDFDINFNGLSNTLLTNYHLHLDDRAFKLAVILTYWMELQQVDGDKNVPNYITTLLVVFYLQQKNILPSVAELQNNVKPDIRNHWNHAFVEKYYRSNTDLELFELLVGFFEYYANFSFDRYVISPFIGYPVERVQFTNYESLPEEFQLYKHNVGNNVTPPINLNDRIIIQGPFIHNENVAFRTCRQVAQKTIAAFKNTYNIYQANSKPDEYLIYILKKL